MNEESEGRVKTIREREGEKVRVRDEKVRNRLCASFERVN
jgi:hypothetical protein